MMVRTVSLFLVVAVLVVFGTAPLVAADKADNTHVGTFVSAKGNEFTMADKDGKEHTHTLAADAKVIGPDGQACKITELDKGQKIRVTTKEGDLKTAIKVEALKKE